MSTTRDATLESGPLLVLLTCTYSAWDLAVCLSRIVVSWVSQILRRSSTTVACSLDQHASKAHFAVKSGL